MMHAHLTRSFAIACLAAAALGSFTLTSAAASPAQLAAADYASAERFLYGNRDKYLLNGSVSHHWIPGEDRFWYQRSNEQGKKEFVVVDAASGKREAAFDHEQVAALLSKALDKPIEAGALPFASFRFADQGRAIDFVIEEKLWTCKLDAADCRSSGALPGGEGMVLSPDRRWAAFLKGHDLWVRAIDGSAEFALTSDGQTDYAYAATPGTNTYTVSAQRLGKPVPPQVVWSPDSKKILTHRLDERKVKELHLLQAAPEDGTQRPKLYSMRYAMANDEHKPLVEQVIFDVASRRKIAVDYPALPTGFRSLVEEHYAWWSDDGASAYFVDFAPYSLKATLVVVDAATGATRTLLEESSKAFVEVADIGQPPMLKMLSNGDFIWFSERDGWGHLYLYDGRTGRPKNRITKGDWRVRGIVRVDERARTLYFTANGREPGRDPYFRHFYRINLDGSGLTLLTPEDAEHQVNILGDAMFALTAPDPLARDGEMLGIAPSGKYFIDTYSRPDLPPVTVLRAIDGRLVATLETADISPLTQGGFTLPERFQAVAADGKTAIYGNILRPSRFDPKKKYPVIDAIYPGPQIPRSWRNFTLAVFDPLGAQAVAELGFIVVTVDGRGTPLRSREFLNASYGKLGTAGNLEDHIAALRQLARRHPSMDLDRVGIFGQSGGGFAAARAILAHGDFYKVAVSAAGNHDQRGYIPVWGETYLGADDGKNYLDAANTPLAGKLQGKLLLMHGEMDDNVHPALTMQLVDALIKANKDFDLLIVPNVAHGIMSNPYALRRQWDYFVRHLLGATPPAGYQIGLDGSATE
jgi:dipeptidyl-peptidase 4